MLTAFGQGIARGEGQGFATYATLRRGLGFSKSTLEWYRWVLDHLERKSQRRPMRNNGAKSHAKRHRYPKPSRAAKRVAVPWRL